METTPNELHIESFRLKKAAHTYRAINNNLRLQIFHLLHENKRMTVTSIYVKLRVEQSVASQYLAVLRKGHFVNTEREGKCVYYSINYNRLNELHKYTEQLLKMK